LGPDWANSIHLGSDISKEIKRLYVMRFATRNDEGKGADSYDHWNKNNPCVKVHQEYIPGCMEVEKWKKENIDVCLEDITSTVANIPSGGLDIYTTTLKKSEDVDLGIQIGGIIQALDLNQLLFEAIAFILVGVHGINHRKHHGTALPVLLASTKGAKLWFGKSFKSKMEGDNVIWNVIQHGQVFWCRYHLGYAPERQDEISKSLVDFYREPLQLPDNYRSEVGRCFGHDYWCMSPDIKQAFEKSISEQAKKCHQDVDENGKSKHATLIGKICHQDVDENGKSKHATLIGKICHQDVDENGKSKHATLIGKICHQDVDENGKSKHVMKNLVLFQDPEYISRRVKHPQYQIKCHGCQTTRYATGHSPIKCYTCVTNTRKYITPRRNSFFNVEITDLAETDTSLALSNKFWEWTTDSNGKFIPEPKK